MKEKFTFLLLIISVIVGSAQISIQENIITDNTDAIYQPNTMLSTDIDGDGDMDVVVGSFQESKVVWYENLDGLGNYGARNIISENTGIGYTLAVADIDNDGDMDIVASSYNTTSFFWYENINGLGSFTQRVISLTDQISKIYLVDMNGDGNMDILTSSSITNTIGWYPNYNGDGTFGNRIVIVSNLILSLDLAAADINNDGYMDVILSSHPNNSGKVVWYESMNEFGTLFSTENIIVDSPGYVDSFFLNDFDNDSDLDFFIAFESTNAISYYKNTDGLGNFQLELQITNSADAVSSMVVIDADNDGDKDILFSSIYEEDFIAWIENTGGVFGTEHIITTNVYDPNVVFASDVNGDGKMDVISSSMTDNKVAWYNNEDGQGNFNSEYNITGHADGLSHIKNADIDGDGFMDVISVSSNDNKLAWYRNIDGQGNFSTQKIISLEFAEPRLVDVADIDDDGDMDIVVNKPFGDSLIWFENLDGLGNFSESITISSYPSMNSLVIADLDNDGDLDIIFGSDSYVGWFENINGVGTFSALQQIASIDNVESIFLSDLDGDGDLDIITASYYDLISWFENTDGLGNFGTRQNVSNNFARPSSVFSADIDGDGDNDVVATFRVENYVVWFENDGLGNFAEFHIITDEIEFGKSVIVADLDADGDEDVLSASVTDNKIAYYLNIDGSGNFGPQQIISNTALSAFQVLVADINGNGAIDVLSASLVDSKIAWYGNQFLGVENIILENLSIYPNPTSSFISIKYSGTIEQVKIYNELGQLILEENDSKGITAIDIENLSSGVYFIKLRDNSANEIVKKLIKN